MKKFIFAFILLIGLLSVAVQTEASVIPESTAKATTCPPVGACFGGHVHHHADDGYDPYIKVVCQYGSDNERWIYEGEDSKEKCGVDTDQIYIRYGEELWCYKPPVLQSGGYWEKMFDEQGRHKINDQWYFSCTLRKD